MKNFRITKMLPVLFYIQMEVNYEAGAHAFPQNDTTKRKDE
jgi:hypothetical protein